jgi:hypothetical protein
VIVDIPIITEVKNTKLVNSKLKYLRCLLAKKLETTNNNITVQQTNNNCTTLITK